MPLLLLKLALTPILVGGASLAARRWGPAVGGWVVSLPLTSGPVLLFIALEHGPAFAADTSVGTLLGLGAIVAYCLGFIAASARGPLPAIVAAALAYAAAGVLLEQVADWPFPVLVALVVVAIAVAIRRLPETSGARSATPHPAWDLPARVIVGTTLVVALVSIAPLLGPVAAGIVTTFPVYVSVLAMFAFHHDGRPAALGVLRGLLVGLSGTVAFFVAVHALVVPAGTGPAFVVAIVATLAIQAAMLPRVLATAAGLGPEPV